MHPEFGGILDYLRRQPINLTITSNGYSIEVLDDAQVTVFKGRGILAGLSDGGRAGRATRVGLRSPTFKPPPLDPSRPRTRVRPLS
jgi:hypothetical protein